jgi:hypothetical protein
MKKPTVLSMITLCVFALNTASAQSNPNSSPVRDHNQSRYSQPGQPGYNGSGEGLQHNLLLGTGDGLINTKRSSAFSGGSGEKAALPDEKKTNFQSTGAKPKGPKPVIDEAPAATHNKQSGRGPGEHQ